VDAKVCEYRERRVRGGQATVEGAVRDEVKGRTHPFVSVSAAMASAGAKALAFRSKVDVSKAGDVITAMGP
jgi:hypothetical protein